MIAQINKGVAGLVGLALALGCLVAGCSNGSTSGFKPASNVSANQINQVIAQVRANPKMPQFAKDQEIAALQKKLADAK